MSSEKLISVVMPLFYSASCLDKTLEALFAVNYPKEHIELVFSYFPSDDSTLEIVQTFQQLHEKEYFNIKILERHDRGVSFGRNLGIKNCSGNYIFLLDDDIALLSETFNSALKIFESTEGVAVVCFAYALLNTGILDYASFFRFEGKISKTQTFGTGCAMLTKRVFDEVGLFDEQLGYPYSIHEDLEIAARIKKAGYDIVINGQLTQTHLPKKRYQPSSEPTPSSNLKLTNYLFKRTKFYFTNGADSYHSVLASAPQTWRLELAMYFFLPLFFVIFSVLGYYLTAVFYALGLCLLTTIYWRAFNFKKFIALILMVTNRILRSYGYVFRRVSQKF